MCFVPIVNVNILMHLPQHTCRPSMPRAVARQPCFVQATPHHVGVAPFTASILPLDTHTHRGAGNTEPHLHTEPDASITAPCCCARRQVHRHLGVSAPGAWLATCYVLLSVSECTTTMSSLCSLFSCPEEMSLGLIIHSGHADPTLSRARCASVGHVVPQ